MTVSSPLRHAVLILIFGPGQEFLIDGLESLNGVERVERQKGTQITIQSGPADGQACEVHLEMLWSRASRVMGDVVKSGSSVAYCALQIVQYIGQDDLVGPGIPIDAKWVSALASVGGCLDIDQYILETPSGG